MDRKWLDIKFWIEDNMLCALIIKQYNTLRNKNYQACLDIHQCKYKGIDIKINSVNIPELFFEGNYELTLYLMGYGKDNYSVFRQRILSDEKYKNNLLFALNKAVDDVNEIMDKDFSDMVNKIKGS